MDANSDLVKRLSAAIAGMDLPSVRLGQPETVEQVAREAERLFQGYAKANTGTEDAYAAALAFLRGKTLDSWERDRIASAIADPVRERNGEIVLGSSRFSELLKFYEDEAQRGELWRLTWHGLLYAYFRFDPTLTRGPAAHQGWAVLRAFLQRTWPLIDQQAGSNSVPDWIAVLRKESDVLSEKPADRYAMACLQGDSTATDQLAEDLGIPPSSWFWHALVLSGVRRATASNDTEFRRLIPRLLHLIDSKPAFRDEAIEAILIRYHACRGTPQDESLRDYVCQPRVWKNPKLKQAGLATAWNRVPEPVWQMVLAWVNEGNLRDFFAILAARNKADEGRLAFWSKYIKQITWTRLVFGEDTIQLKNTHRAIRELIAREEGAYARLRDARDLDAFMMQIGSYLIIEFSKKPNACYAYVSDQLPFKPYDQAYAGDTSDLKAGYYGKRAARISHQPGWEAGATDELRRLGIFPDRQDNRNEISRPGTKAGTTTTRSTTAHLTPPPDISSLHSLVSRFRGASIDDNRTTTGGGRLWVVDPLQRTQLAAELQSMGFRWAAARQAWYLPEH
ncbi:EH signature domain-containing protein [Cupriavidus laharis]|nr:EH signature domain-containing protein [Cupriavidus laharis]